MALVRIADMVSKPRKSYRRTFIREWRKKRGLSQEQLAARIDVRTSAISYLERGQSAYTQGKLEAIAEALQTTTWHLLSVDPTKEGEVVDLTEMLRKATPEQRAEIIGFARGRLHG